MRTSDETCIKIALREESTLAYWVMKSGKIAFTHVMRMTAFSNWR